RVLRRRFWWILVPAVLISVLGVIFAVVVPKKYVARSQVMVYDRPGARTQGGAPNTAEGRVAGHKIKAPQRIIAVLRKLEWPEYDELPTNADALEYRNKVIKNITVETPVMESNVGQQLVRVSYAHTNANQAIDFLRELLADWKFEVLETNKRALVDSYDKFAEQLADLEKQRVELNREIVQLRRDNQIEPPPQGRSLREYRVPAFDDVDKLERRVGELQDLIDKQEFDIALQRAQYNGMRDTVVMTAAGTGQTALEQAERELAAAVGELEKGGYAPNNSHYKRISAQIDAAQKRVNQLRGIAPGDSVVQSEKPNEEKVALGRRIGILEAQLSKMRSTQADVREQLREANNRALGLQRIYNEIEAKTEDRDNVQTLIRDTLQEQNKIRQQIARQEGPLGNPFDELEQVTASDRPIEPNALLLSAISVLLGLGVGTGLALFLEYSRNCFRSINDIARSMEIPVLGAINRIETRKQRSVRHAQKLIMSVVMGLMVAVVGYTLWAWVVRPDLLTPRLVESIDRLREALG
ncbi:MAG TPA: hypothetical protein PLJ12_14330, partial [Planctomycetota bacterium]|nr:hypothetical protein [Planctomycetota bacterium]